MKTIRLFVVMILMGLSLIGIVQAQQSPLTATVDRTSITTDDLLTLTVTVSGQENNMPRPEQPVLDGFNVVSSGTSSQMNIINGNMSVLQSTIYHLQPTEIGTLSIGSFSLTLNGQTYQTDPIQIEVTQGTGQPSSGNSGRSSGGLNFSFPPSLFNSPFSSGLSPFGGRSPFDTNNSFVEAEIDNDSPYIGEQVTYTFRYYESIGAFGQPTYAPPDFTGFWHDFQPDQKQYTAQAGTDVYRVTELQTFLFPTNAGDITIDPTTLTVQGSLFGDDTKLSTDAITVNVNALPPNAPDDFTGAVGKYSISANLVNTTVNAGDPITINVKIQGVGNINTLPDPTWDVPQGWRTFDATSTVNTKVENGKLAGSKDFEYLVIPNSGGTFEIPPFSLSYFDPQTEEYQTISTDSLTVTVNGDVVPTQAVESIEQPAVDIPEVKTTSLSPIRESVDALQSAGKPLTSNPLFWMAWIIPALMVTGSIGYERRQRYLMENSDLIRRSRAYKHAQHAIKQARQKSADLYAAAGDILAQYIEAKLGRSLNGLTHDQLGDILADHGISSDNIQQALNTLYTVDVVRYGAFQGTGDILSDTASLITTLEKEFKQ